MNTEELKMILDAVTSLGANGKEAFIWWLAIKYLAHYITVLIVAASAAGVIIYLTKRCWDADKDEQLVKRIATLLEKADPYGDVSRNNLYEAVRDLAKASPK